jgi:nicotinate-nucleotide adenylyltransferase
MRVLCFGGTFNPIHHGHLICARAVAEAAGFGQVLLVPNAQSPHRLQENDMAAANDRLTMCQLAAQIDPLFAVSDIELQRAEPSFTIETARTLKRNGWTEVHWLIGADAVQNLPRWHEAANLTAEVRFVVMARPGWDFAWDVLPETFRALRHNVVPAPLLQISATDVRRRVAAGQSIDFLTPPAVVRHIHQRGLYRPANPPAQKAAVPL